MSQELEDGEFWLPLDFLTDDDDLLLDFKPDRLKTKAINDFAHAYANPFGFNSGLNSPVDSAVGSAETESDEDELVASITRKMPHPSFLDSGLFSDYNLKGKLSSSPQSTLGSCKRVPEANSVSRFPSAPIAASGKFAEKQTMHRTTPLQSTDPFTLHPGSDPVHAALRHLNPTVVSSSSTQAEAQAQLAYFQLQAIRVKQFQMMELGFLREAGRTQGPQMAAWPTLPQTQPQQPQPCSGSGMRRVFLGVTGLIKGRTGTGVFLPRPYGPNPQEIRSKQAMVPEPVAYAMKTQTQTTNEEIRTRAFSTPSSGPY